MERLFAQDCVWDLFLIGFGEEQEEDRCGSLVSMQMMSCHTLFGSPLSIGHCALVQIVKIHCASAG